ncbi:Gfo/Idh/MocA family protein [Nakamurella sp. GG22]
MSSLPWDLPPVRVGLVGAGTWARRMHAPMLAHGPETRLVGVWARRPAEASELADGVGTRSVASFDELLDTCEAVDFAVPPDVQAELAPRAAARGKAVMLEKPIARDLGQARSLADAVRESGVASIVVLTRRFHPRTRSFLADVADLRGRGPLWGLDGRYLHGGLLGGDFAHGWRLQDGALADLGPHLLDLSDAVLGPVVSLRATGEPQNYLTLSCEHESGAISQLALSGKVAGPSSVTRIDVAGEAGALSWDTVAMDHDECWPVLRAEFASAVRLGTPVTADAARGLVISRLLDAAQRSVRSGETVRVEG